MKDYIDKESFEFFKTYLINELKFTLDKKTRAWLKHYQWEQNESG